MFELNSVATHRAQLQNLLGKGRKLTFRDLKVVNLLYNCSSKETALEIQKKTF